MRTHTALHVLCGVIWADYGIPVTGGNMEPLKGRLDFPFRAMSADLGAAVEKRINDEIDRAHEIVVDFLPRSVADADPALIRTAANLIPAEIDPLRVIDIVGLDRQADGGTHVLSTAEVGRVGSSAPRARARTTSGSVSRSSTSSEPRLSARLVVTQNITVDGRIEFLDDWFQPSPTEADVDDLQDEMQRPGLADGRDAAGAADLRGLPRLLAAAHRRAGRRRARAPAEVRRLRHARRPRLGALDRAVRRRRRGGAAAEGGRRR